VSVTYFSVTALLIPANLLMKKISAKVYFPMIMILWGVIVMSIAGVKSAAGLLTARFFLGVPEAGVVPATIMYFTFWYKPSERAIRIGIFHSANSLALAVSGFAAIGINRVSSLLSDLCCRLTHVGVHLQLNGKHGLKSWQWVFIIEGILPIAMAAPVFWLLLTFPETSTALTERGM
jgi:sugar phosphate permease